MSDKATIPSATEANKPIPITHFLELSAPHSPPTSVSGLIGSSAGNSSFQTADLTLFCDHKKCQGDMQFSLEDNIWVKVAPYWQSSTIDYRCKNCGRTMRTYCLLLLRKTIGVATIQAFKIGENPEFGIRVDPSLEKKMGSHKDLLRQAVRAESHGLGIGAFSYYRQVVESIKNKLIDQMLAVVEQVSPESDVVSQLKAAREAKSFASAVDEVKAGLPTILMIDGHNPLKLVHDALSEGLHNETDADCLELSHDVRIILSQISEICDRALAERKQFGKAVDRLVNLKGKKAKEK